MDDRHKKPQIYLSGAQKRKISEKKKKDHLEVLAKTSKLDKYFPVTNLSNVTDESYLSNPVQIATSPQGAEELSVNTTSQQTNVNENDINIVTVVPEQEKNYNHESDIGLWAETLTEAMIDFWIIQGSTKLQHCEEKVLEKFSMPQSRDDGYADRKFSKNLFQRTLPNKEKLDRSWLCFSLSTGKIYCFVCKLLAEERESYFIKPGFCDWRHASERVAEHEKSKNHVNSMVAFATRANLNACINKDLQQQVCIICTVIHK